MGAGRRTLVSVRTLLALAFMLAFPALCLLFLSYSADSADEDTDGLDEILDG